MVRLMYYGHVLCRSLRPQQTPTTFQFSVIATCNSVVSFEVVHVLHYGMSNVRMVTSYVGV